MPDFSTRSQIVTRRTYNRPIDEDGALFETWEQTVERCIRHQRNLWTNAVKRPLDLIENRELEELRELLLERKALLAGRTLWLGGTDIAERRAASQFNCSFTKLETVHDAVDMLWLLLQGCGVGFEPVVGTLSGFTVKPQTIIVQRSERTDVGGRETNLETWDPVTRTWTLSVGDCATSWAKSIGKILAMKQPANTIVLDFGEIRPGGRRLRGYGWISSGDATISKAWEQVCNILGRRAGQLLDEMDLLDIGNWMGTVLSSRRSAEIALLPYANHLWKQFATAKDKWWEKGNDHRQQSNNSLMFEAKPTRVQLEEIFQLMVESGGSEPGFVNKVAAMLRAPWFKGFNPCVEILLANKGFCNLVTICLPRFNGDLGALLRALYIMARANYRQTIVDLRDGILQDAWHQNNEFLRLCGTSLTGIVGWSEYSCYNLRQLRRAATFGADSMADELGTPRAKNVTTVKPEGTGTKTMGLKGFEIPEGIHKPLGRYIFNNIVFASSDPLVALLREAGYRVFDHPSQPDSVLVTFPVEYSSVEFDVVDGKEVNLESAVSQLNRYRDVMVNYCDQNVSNTISYDPSEVPAIIDWLLENWDSYVGVSFLFRNDPTKTAKDLGYAYLPQEVVTKEVYDEYSSRLRPINLDQPSANSFDEIDSGDACVGGVCPVR